LNVVVHAAALIFAVIGLRPGSPLVELEQRMAYLSSYPLGWSLGWGSWMLCTIALVAFFAVLARHLPEHPDLARLAVVLAVAGGAIDWLCDVVYIVVLPMIASWGPSAEMIFVTWERTAVAGGLIVANGLYTLGTLLLNQCLRGRPGVAPMAVEAGYGVVVFGILLVVAGFTPVPWLAEWATGPTIGLFCVWTLLAAHSLRRRENGP
jgi:hypothetical protein